MPNSILREFGKSGMLALPLLLHRVIWSIVDAMHAVR